MRLPRISQRGITVALLSVMIAMSLLSLAFMLLGGAFPSGAAAPLLGIRLGLNALSLVLYLRGWKPAGLLFVAASVAFTAVSLTPAYFAAGFPLGMLMPIVAVAIVSDWRGILLAGAALVAIVALRHGMGVISRPTSLLTYAFCVLGIAGLWILLESARLEAARRADELARSAGRLRFQSSLLDRVGQIVVAGDLRGRITYWNEAAERLHGWKAEEILAMEAAPVLMDGTPEERERHRAAIASGSQYSQEATGLRKDGSSFPVIYTVSPLAGESGAVEGWVAVGMDIGERKAAELALAESERRLRTIVSNLPLIVFTMDREGRYTFSDGAGLAHMGRKPGQGVGFSAFDLYRERPDILRGLARALGGESVSAEEEMGGRVFSARYIPLRDEAGEVTGIIGVALDVTERAQAERQVLELNRELEAKVAERTAQLSEANESLRSTLADLRSAQDRLVLSEKMAALGKLVAGIAHEINTPLGAISSSARALAEELASGLLPLLDGYARLDEPGRAAFSRILDGAISSGISLDGAEERRRRKEVERVFESAGIAEPGEAAADFSLVGDEAAAAEALSFIGGAEGRASLAALERAAAAFRSSQVIEAAAEQAARVIRALRVYARREAAEEAVPVDLRAELGMVLALYRDKLKLGVEVRTSFAEDSRVLARPGELRQVWLNLIANAAQAMDYKGTLELATRVRGAELEATVADSGPGIPPEAAPRIFEPFFTTKREGTGLGLDIARRAVESNGGSLSFESRPGLTVFKVILPRPPA
ncbi:MAG TPA: PAS domain-containing protein [Spirochaetales bacterium]|nr:PAS domain-containing protein [Spirochaetales bacterium]